MRLPEPVHEACSFHAAVLDADRTLDALLRPLRIAGDGPVGAGY
jgi:hypothetical protein